MFDFPNSPTIGQIYEPTNGLLYEWDGVAWVAHVDGGGYPIVDRYYSSGSGTWPRPQGITLLEVWVQGAGGGGGSVTGVASNSNAGAGGGGGGMAYKLYQPGTIPATAAYSIGTGGAAGSSPNGAGSPGGTSSFDTLSATGGTGGSWTGVTNQAIQWPGGAPGTGSGGDLNLRGSPGGNAFVGTGTTIATGGAGGTAASGHGGPSSVGGSSSAVNAAGTQGAGGGGGVACNSAAFYTGGAGGSGWIRVREHYGKASQPIIASKRTVITASTSTFQYDTTTLYADIEVLGGGGGGGATSGGSAVGTAVAGSGGGAGGYCKKLIKITDDIRAATKTIVVGAGGASNTNGGISSYTDGTNTLATTAAGSGAQGSWTSNAQTLFGGNGGSSSGGDINSQGARGESSQSLGSANCGASTSACRAGAGASSIYGGGGYGYIWTAGGTANFANGAPAGGYGAGGGGGAAQNAASQNVIGGTGSQGVVIITEYTGAPAAGAVSTALDQNLIVNPAMQISQEWATNTTYTVNGTYADQWGLSFSGPTGGTHVNFAVYTASDLGAPYGALRLFGGSTAYTSIAAGNWVAASQMIEGVVAAALGWGTAAAEPAVLSFEAYSTVAGTFAVALRNATPDLNIVFPFTFAAGEINTWKRFTYVVPAIATGTWPKTTAKGLEIWFTAMAGSTYTAPSPGVWASGTFIGLVGQSNLLATASQSLYVRNVGLYPDPDNTGVAPTFKVPDFASELMRCQRYYEKSYDYANAIGSLTSGGAWFSARCPAAATETHTVPFRVQKRVVPTMTTYSRNTGASGMVRNESAGADVAATVAAGEINSRTSWTAAVNAPYSWHWVANARM